MWGYIITEASTITNFNFGFMTYKSDILIHLSQWQYWWWFWFSLFWVMYFFIIVRVLHKRTFHLNPIVNTSIRGHGKWGDFLVAIIPLSWCGNILVNSNFILRMIEWQNESSLFTLRVQGKQWYWVYKFDSSAASSILAAPKNIGHNKWLVNTPLESYQADTYYQALHLGAQLETKEIYLKELSKSDLSNSTVRAYNFSRNSLLTNHFLSEENFTAKNLPLAKDYILIDFSKDTWVNKDINILDIYNIPAMDNQTNFTNSLLTSVKKKPLSFLAGVLNKHNIELLKNNSLDRPIFFTVKFWLNDGLLEQKAPTEYLDWGFKQKRYKRLDKFQYQPRLYYTKDFLYNNNAYEVSNKVDFAILDQSNTIKDNNVVQNTGSIRGFYVTENDAVDYHNTVKYNRHRGELVPTNLARRLLRTKRTLVLPAHVNITVVTNSYDVVHSWFIPGLGLKMDCVPGRSTHHSFYIDNIGFYYGQCAEICGRYHHHMPIRLCALPFEQFLIWWQRRGVRRIHRIHLLNDKARVNVNDIKFRYRW